MAGQPVRLFAKVARPANEDNESEPGETPLHPRWWQLTSEQQKADEICSICDELEHDDQPRRSKYLTNLQLYELRALTGLHAYGYYTTNVAADTTLPILRSLCDTVQADIAGRQRPIAQFMTSGADWTTRRRAKKLGKFVEAILHQPQGSYVNGWELAVDTFLDCCIYGVGIIHVYVDAATEKVVLERVPPEQLHVDAREAEAGEPLNFFRAYLYDEDRLILEFKREDETEQAHMLAAIQAAATTDKSLNPHSYGYTRIARSVKVREAIRVPIANDEPGERAWAVPGFLLEREDWKRGEPYVYFRWARDRRGFWATSLIDEAKLLGEELNRNFSRMQERMELCANKRTWIPMGGAVREDELEANEHENFVHFDGPVAPIETNVPALTPSDTEFFAMVKSLCYEMPGVSQASATSRKEPGVVSGIAMRTAIDLATKRFSVKARYAYEYPFVSLARKIVAAVAEYAEATGRDITVNLPKKKSVLQINWKDVKLDTELDVQIAPASSLPNDPSGRLSTVFDLFNAQVIGPATFKRLLDWPDLEQEASRDQAEWEYVESVLEKYLDAAEDEADDVFVPADGYLLRKEQALLQTSSVYFEARRDGAPEHVLKLLRRYMQSLGDLIERQQTPPAAAGMPAGLGLPAGSAVPSPTLPGGPPGPMQPIPPLGAGAGLGPPAFSPAQAA